MSELIQTKKQNEILKLPYLVLTILLLATLGASYLFYQSSKAKDAARFQNEVGGARITIENRVNIYIAMLKAGRGFIESDGKISQQEFADFINNLELEKNYSGIQAIGFTKRLRDQQQRAELINEMRMAGFSDFDVYPLTGKDETQAISLIAPFNESNKNALGFDMSSNPIRDDAMQRARRTGAAAASGRVYLIQEPENDDRQAGFLIYLPVNGNVRSPGGGEADGFVYGAFRGGDFLNEILATAGETEIAATIYDAEKKEENILAVSGAERPTGLNSFQSTQELNVAGRKWIIEFRSLPAFEAQSTLGWMPLILSGGLLFSLLLFAATYSESRARLRSEKIADDLRESEKEKALLLEREQKARRAAERANQAKDEFISIVSHELRTPLNSIAGWSRILQAENITAATRKQALQKIDKSLRVQTGIIEELLDFSQMVAEPRELKSVPVPFSDVFEESYAEIMNATSEKGVSLVKKNCLNGHEVLGDRERLLKVLRNLFSNAVKFTPRGGEIIAETKEQDEMVELRVKDTGKGIKPDFLPHIFDRFSQADSSSTRQFGGLGIGLTVSQHIVEMHGGSIVAESEGENKGALFIVRLPFIKK